MPENEVKKKSKTKRVLLIILISLLALIVILASAFFIMRAIGKSQFHKADTGIKVESQIDELEIDENEIEYKGVSYTLDPDVVSILFMGVDKKDINADLGYGKNGQADSIFVAAINTRTKTIKLIPISRETMVDVSLYNTGGEYAGVKHEQLCLAYAYGDTPESCSKNVLESVRRALYGINITSYVSIELDGVEKITDTVGGITLPCLEEFKVDGRVYKVGETLNLDGYLARQYIQNRSQTDIYGNTRRMQRQKQFLSAFANKAGNNILDNFSNLASYYNTMEPHISTNLTLPQITYLASSCLSLNIGDEFDYKLIEGETTTDGTYVQFIPDEKSTLDTIVDVFYMKK